MCKKGFNDLILLQPMQYEFSVSSKSIFWLFKIKMQDDVIADIALLVSCHLILDVFSWKERKLI